MTRGIFDPTGGETEHSGSTFTPQDAEQTSQMPPDITDGEVSEEEAAELEQLSQVPDPGLPAAERLEETVQDEFRVDRRSPEAP
jgi:hypothetical protein